MYKILTRTFVRENTKWVSSTTYLVQKTTANIGNVEKKESKVSNLKRYWFDRYINYIKNIEKRLEKKFPTSVHIYRIFRIGTTDLYSDLKNYIAVKAKQNFQSTGSLTRKELQLTYTMPRDLIKIAPVLLIGAVPFTNYIILPLAYLFPRHLLTSHYWTPEQKITFLALEHKKRLKHNRPLFRCVQGEIDKVKDPKLKRKWAGVIACLGSGTHPTTKDILMCSSLFTNVPYSLNVIKRKHLKELLAIHGISTWTLFKKRRLIERCALLKQMDDAIQREGGVDKMPVDSLQWALSFRGVNPTNMSVESMRAWLKEWLVISGSVNENSMSLLLHSPILLAYNHPMNWTLLYN